MIAVRKSFKRFRLQNSYDFGYKAPPRRRGRRQGEMIPNTEANTREMKGCKEEEEGDKEEEEQKVSAKEDCVRIWSSRR